MNRPRTTPTPLPISTRRGLIVGAVLMVVIAAAVNISHTRQNATDNGQTEWPAMAIGLIPDAILVLSVMRLRYHRRSVWAWTGVVGAVGMVAWSALATAGQGHGAGGQVMALSCLAFAIIATGQAHVPASEPVGIVMAHVEALADDAIRTTETVREDVRREAQDAVRTVREDAEVTVREASAKAAQDVMDARADASALAVRVAEMDASLASVRASYEALLAASADAAKPSVRTRPGTVRKASAGQASTPSDMRRRASARDGFKASVRADDPWTNGRLACAMFGCQDACQDGDHRPAPDALSNARRRASEWKREVADETRADGTGGR